MTTSTGDGSNSRSDVVSDVDSDDDDMYYVSKNEVNGNPIVTKALIGRDNFVSWKKSIEIALSARLKLSFIQGNDVMTAWNILHARFAGTNLAMKSGLMKEANSLVQGDMDVATYHGKLSKFWQELDSIKKISVCPANGNCVCCGEADDEKREDRVVQFLMGLNECYSMIKTQVFAMSKVPDMDVVFEMVTREESQRSATKTRYVEASAMFGQNNNYQHSQGNYQPTQGSNSYQNGQNTGGQMRQMSAGRGGFNKNKPRLFCTPCQMTGHLKENCYKLIGYPPGHKLHNGSESYKQGTTKKFSANNVNGNEEAANTTNQASGSFTTEQLNQIMNMIKSGGMNQSSTHMEMVGTAFSYNAAVDSQPMMEETILVGDYIMLGPPSPLIPPEIASHVLNGACKSMTSSHFARVSLFCTDNVQRKGSDIACYVSMYNEGYMTLTRQRLMVRSLIFRIKELRKRREHKLGLSMPFDDAKVETRAFEAGNRKKKKKMINVL
ncbi:hypothetical protein QQ045_005397 [Rhodiola kirilowii]